MTRTDRATLLLHREVMLKRAHGALADAGCVVPIELDRTIEHAIYALKERALTAEDRLEQMTRERDEALAELSALRKDYDSVLEANVGLLDDAPWADVRRAYIRGAEAMREACAARVGEYGVGYRGLTGSAVAEMLRALPTQEDEP